MASLDSGNILGPDGPIAQELGEAFEARPQQVEMARAAARAMEHRTLLMVEAGTGVGKSFAYLAPAIIRAAERRERVVIATNTIALQEQLVEKDAPLVKRAVERAGAEREVRIVLVKGRGNYISVRRLALASARQATLLPEESARRTLRAIEDWAYATTDGSLATLPVLERPAVWDRVQSDSGNCMGRRCPTYGRCFYQQARRRMEGGDVLICNHALYFSDLALRARGAGFLPEHQHVILDEAHGVEETASEHFGRSLSEGRVRHLLALLRTPRTGRGFLATLALGDLGVTGAGDDALSGAVERVIAAGEAAAEFFDRLAELAGAGGGVARMGPGATENGVTPAFRDLALRLKRLKERTAGEEDKFELNAFAERAAAVADDAEALIGQTEPGCAYWVETSGGADDDAEGSVKRGRRRVTLASAPVEVGPVLRERLFTGEKSVVMTSATLTTAEGSFEHAKGRLGCEEAETLALGTPFDLAEQVEVFIDATAPDPRSPGYVEALVERIVEHVRATDGGAFALFTSLATMRNAAALLRPALTAMKIPTFVQDEDGPRGLVLKRFLEDERSVLLGVASFWQGVDVRGRALRNVIITRLPFEPPERPLTEARLERIKERGGDPFMEDSLPRAVIRFRQGFGRLVRSATDRGRVVVLDPRIVTKGYGRAFVEAMPRGVRVNVKRRDGVRTLRTGE